MELITSAVIAYILSGISQVTKDLGSRAIDRPFWAMRLTPGKTILIALTWVTRPFIENFYSSGQVARAIAFGLLSVIVQMVVLTAFIWGCIAASALLFDSTIFQVITTAILIVVGALFVLPLANLVMMPLTLLVAWPLDLLFPAKNNQNAQDIKWCRNCKHYRKSKEYEDALSGLWHSQEMPRSDKLPCKIVLETSAVWERYYESDPRSRTLFPKECPSLEKQA